MLNFAGLIIKTEKQDSLSEIENILGYTIEYEGLSLLNETLVNPISKDYIFIYFSDAGALVILNEIKEYPHLPMPRPYLHAKLKVNEDLKVCEFDFAEDETYTNETLLKESNGIRHVYHFFETYTQEVETMFYDSFSRVRDFVDYVLEENIFNNSNTVLKRFRKKNCFRLIVENTPSPKIYSLNNEIILESYSSNNSRIDLTLVNKQLTKKIDFEFNFNTDDYLCFKSFHNYNERYFGLMKIRSIITKEFEFSDGSIKTGRVESGKGSIRLFAFSNEGKEIFQTELEDNLQETGDFCSLLIDNCLIIVYNSYESNNIIKYDLDKNKIVIKRKRITKSYLNDVSLSVPVGLSAKINHWFSVLVQADHMFRSTRPLKAIFIKDRIMIGGDYLLIMNMTLNAFFSTYVYFKIADRTLRRRKPDEPDSIRFGKTEIFYDENTESMGILNYGEEELNENNIQFRVLKVTRFGERIFEDFFVVKDFKNPRALQDIIIEKSLILALFISDQINHLYIFNAEIKLIEKKIISVERFYMNPNRLLVLDDYLYLVSNKSDNAIIYKTEIYISNYINK
ncbi:hypothetical protein [Emticicia sp. C21]|uniref:hypothetical protein n=1 Tax=Emticicia sp. C21 TaxID=2302915 RepID=UPI000E34B0D2|nr:hypothetical protein [Emticicia sp. C21]RFS14388.1 hypothetical protein D0T08_21170 [Emticicia sp. C21]